MIKRGDAKIIRGFPLLIPIHNWQKSSCIAHTSGFTLLRSRKSPGKISGILNIPNKKEK